MRFLCVYKPEVAESHAAPAAEERAAMSKLIGDMAKAGVLLGVEGCLPSDYGARVRIQDAKYSVTDGPFSETKELIAGFCLLQVKSKDEAVEWTKRFLAAVGKGTTEVRQLHETPAG